MQAKNLTDILTKQGWTKDGDAHVAPKGGRATVYLSFQEDALIIDGVIRIDIEHEVASVVTQKREQYGVEVDSVLALRFAADNSSHLP